jgi:hypothetical protein
MAFMTWAALEEELGRWRDAGRTVEFWWRDDDAVAPTPQVAQLLELSARSGVPLALAVIPLAAKAELFDGMRARVLLHGTDHRNRAQPGHKKSEFAEHEPDDAALGRLGRARERLAQLAGPAFLPVLAPPWNRFKRELVPVLASIGVRGLSGYGARAARRPAAGVIEANTHVDIIQWRATRAFCGEDAALGAAIKHLAARRSGAADSAEPTGWLTHHELHDGAAWNFLEQLFDRTRRVGARWLDAESIFTSSP